MTLKKSKSFIMGFCVTLSPVNEKVLCCGHFQIRNWPYCLVATCPVRANGLFWPFSFQGLLSSQEKFYLAKF